MSLEPRDVEPPFAHAPEREEAEEVDRTEGTDQGEFARDHEARDRQRDDGRDPDVPQNLVQPVAGIPEQDDGAQKDSREGRGKVQLDGEGGGEDRVGRHRVGLRVVLRALSPRRVAPTLGTGSRLNPAFVNRSPAFVNDTDPSFALRDLRRDLGRIGTLAGLAGAAVVLTLAGAFGTDAFLRPVPRLAYWAAMVALTYSAGFLATALLRRRLSGRLRPAALAGLCALGTAAAVAPVVLILNAAALGYVPDLAEAPGVLATVAAIAAVISLVFFVAARETPDGAARRPPPLLDRLPPAKRGALVSLTVEDHYVRVRTTGGEEMVLMRLSDAIRETEGTPGLQVHRSHWVALDQIATTRRDGDRAILTLRDGREVPVSRANLPALRQAGLLPRPR
jgi:DNA-binding LytR/AlgR family response regulator